MESSFVVRLWCVSAAVYEYVSVSKDSKLLSVLIKSGQKDFDFVFVHVALLSPMKPWMKIMRLSFWGGMIGSEANACGASRM